MALLINPDATASVSSLDSAEFMLERWPYRYQLDSVVGANGKRYRFDIFVDEEGLLKGLPTNRLASYFAHPLADMLCPMLIQGPAFIVPFDKRVKYTMDDFEAIRDGVVADLGSDSESSGDEESLPDRNARGSLATIRYKR